MFWMKLFGLIILLAASGAASAQSTVNVRLEATDPDAVGKLFMTALREQISASHLMTLVYGDESALQADIVTMNPDNNDLSQSQTIYSVVINMKWKDEKFVRYLTNVVGVCGKSATVSCAANVKSELDDYADQLRKAAASTK